jgi:hypothetical protein
MVYEVLTVPQKHLAELIAVVRAGMSCFPPVELTDDARKILGEWCEREEAYLEHLAGKDKEVSDDERA